MSRFLIFSFSFFHIYIRSFWLQFRIRKGVILSKDRQRPKWKPIYPRVSNGPPPQNNVFFKKNRFCLFTSQKPYTFKSCTVNPRNGSSVLLLTHTWYDRLLLHHQIYIQCFFFESRILTLDTHVLFFFFTVFFVEVGSPYRMIMVCFCFGYYVMMYDAVKHENI